MKRLNIVGDRYGLLTVTRQVPNKAGRTQFECLCDCGATTTVELGNLRAGNTKSCGCFRSISLSASRRKPARHTIQNAVLRYYKRNAKVRGIPWDLSAADFFDLIFLPCYLCGVRGGTRSCTPYGETVLHNGLDRIRNSVGYTFDNSFPCCKRCNQGKNDQSLAEFQTWVQRVNRFRWGR